MSKNNNIKNVKDLLKSSVNFKDFKEVLKLKTDTIIGIDNISCEMLIEKDINTIEDLAKQTVENPIKIKRILPQVLLKWIKIAKLIEKLVKQKLKKEKKLLMIGLDNGGKTSILAIIQERFSIIKDLLPTRGVQREKLDFFGFPIISWDLGGQVVYREKLYFDRPEMFFSEADLILYVVDSQDPDRFAETVNYFRQVLKSMEDIGEYPPIVIVIHKSDEDIRKTHQWQNNIDIIKNKFNAVFSIFKNFTGNYCYTSIFQKETIMQMFSIALKRVSETSEIIEHILEDFTEKIEGKGTSIISMDGLIFGSYTQSKTDEKLINNTALILQTLSNFHCSIGFKRENTITLDFPMNDFTIQGEKLFEYSDLKIPIYLWLLSEKPEKLYEKIDYFKEQISPLINLFL
ncbi:MAG: ADP-ribosylation factor-like protein [Promethearchaeota archaeon]